MGSWQAKNWDPAVGSTRFEEFCEFLDKPILSQPELAAALNSTIQYDADRGMVLFDDGFEVELALLNYAKYIREVRRLPLSGQARHGKCKNL